MSSPLPILEPCDRRGEEARAGVFVCRSNRLIHPEPGLVSASTCAVCLYRNQPDRPSPAARSRTGRGRHPSAHGSVRASGRRRRDGDLRRLRPPRTAVRDSRLRIPRPLPGPALPPRGRVERSGTALDVRQLRSYRAPERA